MAAANHNDAADVATKRRLVLCFDGTGNKFSGDSSDTNIVKLYQMLDRKIPEQFHYYQPGIGTWAQNQPLSITSTGGFFRRMKANITATIDQAIGSSFRNHVIAGYQFIMRYFSSGDDICIFGFSRGAYTARFLAEMVQTIGLLSQGNEEMVLFAWSTFSEYQQSRGRDPQTPEDQARVQYMNEFKNTFCRQGVKIYFLGLFDCVNSVGQFEIPLFRKSYRNIANPAATNIRHAVSIHERRLKFKPALLTQDKVVDQTEVKEVWFAGNHGDVGGGWRKQPDQLRQLSDTPLAWMVQELKDLKGTENRLAFSRSTEDQIRDRDAALSTLSKPSRPSKLSNHEKRKEYMKPHDMLKLGGGETMFKVAFWWLIEVLPFFTRLELEKGEWVPRYNPNFGANRDVKIPRDAVIHPSVEQMRKAGVLTDDLMPKLGDDEDSPKLDSPIRAIKDWDKLRKARAAGLLSKGKQPSSADGSTTSLLSAARSWDNTGHIGAKCWRLD